jgi:hypothetical protein
MVKMVVSEVQTQTEQIKAFCQAYNQALNNVSKATQGMGLAQGLSDQGMEAIKGYISSAYPALCKGAIMHSEATVQANEQYIQDYLSTCGSEDLDSDELQAQIDEADALIQEFQRSKDSYAQQKRSLSGEKEKIMGAVFQMAIGIMEAGITRNQAKKAKLQEKLQKFLDFCGRSDSHFAGLKDTGSLLAKGMQALGVNEKGQVGAGSWNGKGFSLTDRSWIKTANQKWQSRLEIKDKQLLDGCTIIHIIDTDRGVDMYMFEKNGRRYPVNERDLSADLRTLIKKYGLNVVKLSPTEMDRRVTEFQKSGKDYFSGATVNLPGFKKLARGQGIVNDLKDSGVWDAAWAVGLTVAAVRNAQTASKKASGANPPKTDFGAENPVSGKDWNNYFKDKYGAGNVKWKNPVNSVDDIINTPSSLTNVNPTDIVEFVQKEGWTVTPLKKGGNAGVPYEQGGGFSMNPPAGTSGSSRYIQYHPGGGHHGDLPYYKVSSPEHGITRIYMNGKVVKE